MESISRDVKYFVTPNNNIVRGSIDGGKLVDAEFFVNKQNEYTTPSQLNSLMKERLSLSQGKISLKQIDRPDFANFNIPIDAGRPKPVKQRRLQSSLRQSVSGGDIMMLSEDIDEFDAGDKKMKGVSLKRKSVVKKTSPAKNRVTKMSDIQAGEKKSDSVTLADIFKQVSLQLANQTSDIITRGGNPSDFLKEDIKFFNKS